MIAASILDTIGHTPHVRINRLFGDAQVWIKSERSNPGGSIKDRIAVAMVEAAEADGSLQPGGTMRATPGSRRCAARTIQVTSIIRWAN
jgi:cysteine synthase